MDKSSTSPSDLKVPVHKIGLVKIIQNAGRPNLSEIIHFESAAHPTEDLGIFACGPGSMQHEIRQAAARQQVDIMKGHRRGGVYLHLEHFE